MYFNVKVSSVTNNFPRKYKNFCTRLFALKNNVIIMELSTDF